MLWLTVGLTVDGYDYLKEFPFHKNTIEKTNFKLLTDIDRLAELPLSEELTVIKTDQVFKGYAISR